MNSMLKESKLLGWGYFVATLAGFMLGASFKVFAEALISVSLCLHCGFICPFRGAFFELKYMGIIVLNTSIKRLESFQLSGVVSIIVNNISLWLAKLVGKVPGAIGFIRC